MAATGNQTSLRKRDLTTQKSTAVAYNALCFQHKTAAGDTGINLAAMTTPTEATSNGFVQPAVQRLADAQLKRNPNVLKLISSTGRMLQPYVSYRVTGNLQIQFIGFTALQDEIFTGYIDPVATNGANIVEISAEPITGTLAANTTDINVGYQFKVNLHSSQQVGQYAVEVDGMGWFRNENNASTGTGNYYEVDNGDGTGTIIRVNTPVDYERSYKLVPIGSVLERPAGSVLQVLEQQAGVISKLTEVLADVAGLDETDLVSGPTSPDLAAFGNRVLALESNRARKDTSNTWTASQDLPGVTTGIPAGAGIVGQVIEVFGSFTAGSTSQGVFTNVNGLSLPLPAGSWSVEYYIEINAADPTGAGANGRRIHSRLEQNSNPIAGTWNGFVNSLSPSRNAIAHRLSRVLNTTAPSTLTVDFGSVENSSATTLSAFDVTAESNGAPPYTSCYLRATRIK